MQQPVAPREKVLYQASFLSVMAKISFVRLLKQTSDFAAGYQCSIPRGTW